MTGEILIVPHPLLFWRSASSCFAHGLNGDKCEGYNSTARQHASLGKGSLLVVFAA